MTPTQRSPLRVRNAPAFTIKAANADGVADVMLYDEIGFWGIQAKEFVPALQALSANTINLHINSPGGDVFDGVAIYNALKQHPANVIVYVDGLAASIASVIAMAGEDIRMAENAFLMIHNAWGLAIGNAADMRKTAGLLDKVDTMIVDTYAKRTEESPDQIAAWMADETWFTAQEALDAGFADAIEGADTEADAVAALAAKFDWSLFAHMPTTLAARVQAPVKNEATPPTKRDVERHLRDAGLSRSQAKGVLASGYTAIATQRDADDADALESASRMAAALQRTAGVSSHAQRTGKEG